MKLKLFVIQFCGALLIVKGFDLVSYLVFNKADLEIFRSQSSFSFYSDFYGISHWLYFISAPGFVGLLLATAISFYINKKKHYHQWPLLVSYILVFISNQVFWHLDLSQFINFRSKYLAIFSVKLIMSVALFISVAIGLLILMMANWLDKLNYYFRFI